VIPQTNYHNGRDGESIEGTIIHWTTGTLSSALAHFSSPSARLSAHYIIDQDGTIVPVVAERDTAYHAGDWMTNLRTIGIEHVAGPSRSPTDAQYAASARLHRELSARYGFALDAQHIRPHRTIVATQCPGTIDVDRIVREASQEEEMTDEEFRRRWLAVYADIEAAKLFDTLKQRDADLASDIALHKHDIPIVQTDTAKLPPR
jgi:hypothetical protein